MTKKDIDTIIKVICPNDEDFNTPCISPAYLKKELEVLSLEQEPCDNVINREEVRKQMIKYGFHAPDMTVTELIEDIFPRGKEYKIVDTTRAESED